MKRSRKPSKKKTQTLCFFLLGQDTHLSELKTNCRPPFASIENEKKHVLKIKIKNTKKKRKKKDRKNNKKKSNAWTTLE